MAKVIYSISAKTNTMGLAEVMIRFSGGRGLQYRLKSGVYCPTKMFDNKKGCIVIPRMASVDQRTALKAKKALDEICAALIECFIKKGKALTIDDLKGVIRSYHNPNEEQSQGGVVALADAIDKYIASHKLSTPRQRGYQVVARMVRRFELWKGEAITLDSFTTKIIAEFEKYLANEHQYAEMAHYADIYEQVEKSRMPQKRGRNAISGILRKLRAVIIWGNEMEWTTNNAFHHYTIPEDIYGTPYYITIEERNAIFAADLSDSAHLAVQRDIFIFQCLIGCRVGDLMRFTKDNLVNGAIEYVPRKTKEGRPVAVRVPLNATAKEIVERYADVEGDSLLPFISEQKYNVAIKKIFARAGITRKVTIINPTTGEEERRPINEIASSHLARRTFIGNLYKKVKDPNLIGALSGHREGSKAFARYRDIDEDMRKELVDLLG